MKRNPEKGLDLKKKLRLISLRFFLKINEGRVNKKSKQNKKKKNCKKRRKILKSYIYIYICIYI